MIMFFKVKIVDYVVRINVKYGYLVGKEMFVFRFKIEWIMVGMFKNINFIIIVYKILLLNFKLLCKKNE